MQNVHQTMLSDLIARVAKSDRHAFAALYQASSARLNALCLSVLKDRREAEEALEQVYIAIWTEAARFADSGLSPTAWLATLARGHAMQRRRGPAPSPVTALDGRDVLAPVRAAYLEGLDYRQLADRQGISPDEARQALHEGLERLAGHAAEDGETFAAAEQALGLRRAEPSDPAQLADWQERLARLADDLTPVMAPARAWQRIREHLGHGAAPLSVDPLERTPWWRSPLGIIAILLAAALGWYLLAR